MRSVAVLAYDGVSTFGLGVTAEVFGVDRSGEGLPRYDYAVTAAEPGLLVDVLRRISEGRLVLPGMPGLISDNLP